MNIIRRQDLKLYPKDNSESNHKTYHTKNRQYSLMIAFDYFHTGKWYFYAANNPNIKASYNSLWENKRYGSEEHCVMEAELWLTKLVNKR